MQASATKSAQKEEKKQQQQEKPDDFALPELEQAPCIEGRPLLNTYVNGKTVLDRDAAYAVVAALTMTLKDAFSFGFSDLQALGRGVSCHIAWRWL